MSSRENSASPSWTYRMEVSPTGQGTSQGAPNVNDPVSLLQILVNFQGQTLDALRQILDVQRQQLELSREAHKSIVNNAPVRSPNSSAGRRVMSR